MKSSTSMWTRRRILRGVVAGSAVTVGLPILDCLLNTNGTAFAATGAPLPTRFATWFWGLGLGEADWRPKVTGAGYEMPAQLEALKPIQKKMNLFSGGEVFLDGQANQTHFTSVQGFMTGKVLQGGDFYGSIDNAIAEVIGAGTRFRSIEVDCDGDAKACWSARADGKQPAEISPLALYNTIFGPEYKDPNAAEFVPDVGVKVRRSVLSGIQEERKALEKRLGAADRAKLDNYFTSVRALEQRLELQLQQPEPLEACTKPSQPPQENSLALSFATDAVARHDVFADLLAHALACGQTRVVNLCISQGNSGLRKQGEAANHHTLSHEEPIDPVLGYQVKCAWFQNLYMAALRRFAEKLDAIQEGDRTLLDRMIVMAYTDHGAARLHSVRNYPVITVGSANGRLKTGMHVPRPGDAVSRVALTIQQAMGVPTSSWGTRSNLVTTPISDVLA